MGGYLCAGYDVSTCYTSGTTITVDGTGWAGGTLTYTAAVVEDDDERSDNEKWLDARIEEVSVDL